MKYINLTRTITYDGSKRLNIQFQDDLLLLIDEDGAIKGSWPWFRSSRTEPSVLSRHAKEYRQGILIVPYVPLRVERNFLRFCQGYLDEQGNCNLPFRGGRLRLRVPETHRIPNDDKHDYFHSPNGKAAEIFRFILSSEQALTVRDIAEAQGCSIGFVSQTLRFMRRIISSASPRSPFSPEEKTAFLHAWKASYDAYPEARFFLFDNPGDWIRRAQNDPSFPFLLGGEYASDINALCSPITFLAPALPTETECKLLGLVESSQGNLRIKKASPYVVERFQERKIDALEAYLTGLRPLSENSSQ